MKYFKLIKHHFSYRLHVEKVLLIDGLIINWFIDNNVFTPSYRDILEFKRMGVRVQSCSSWEKIHFFCYHIVIEEFIALKHPQLVSNLLWTSKNVKEATYLVWLHYFHMRTHVPTHNTSNELDGGICWENKEASLVFPT